MLLPSFPFPNPQVALFLRFSNVLVFLLQMKSAELNHLVVFLFCVIWVEISLVKNNSNFLPALRINVKFLSIAYKAL